MDTSSDLFGSVNPTKRCKRCREIKPLTEFNVARRGRQGRTPRCKECLSQINGVKNRQVPPNVSLPHELAIYLAGLMDGEGYFGLTIIKMAKPGRGRDFCYQARATIGMCSDELLKIRDEVGVGLMHLKTHPPEANSRPCHVWTWNANICRTLVPQIIPYLRVKRRQAELLVEYLEIAAHVDKHDPKAVSDRWPRMDAINEEIRLLNQRGLGGKGRERKRYSAKIKRER